MADEVLRVDGSLSVPYEEVDVRFSASGGPGGQHANKAATRVELRFDVEASPSLRGWQKARIVERLGPVVRVVVDDERSQTRNRAIAFERLAGRLGAALHRDPPRRPTRPTRAAKQRRLDEKRRRGETKATRRRPPLD